MATPPSNLTEFDIRSVKSVVFNDEDLNDPEFMKLYMKYTEDKLIRVGKEIGQRTQHGNAPTS